MARLTIRLMGSFQASIDAVPITNFESNKVRTLLAYLVVEGSQAHSRGKLADLFWPDMPAKRANSNLSQALNNLRTLLHDQRAQPPYLLPARETVQFNPESDHWVDVDAFSVQLAGVNLPDRSHCDSNPGYCQGLQDAVDLYRGDFLTGLAFHSSLAIDEWVLVVRQRLHLLAASWGATLSVGEIAAEVDRGLDFLTADWTDVPARQRSMRATCEHTWELLNERERDIFQSLSVFRGAFTRRAARAVSGASPHDLRALMDRSLLWSKSPGWYELHELLRQFGNEKLARSIQIEREVCARHSAYYLGQLERLGDELKSAGQSAALSNIDLEHENYRAAWNWTAGQGASPELAQVVDVLCLYYDLSLRFEDGESACRGAAQGLSQVQSSDEEWLLRARILTWQSRFTRLLGQLEMASHLLEKAQVLLEKDQESGIAAYKAEAFLTMEKGGNHFHRDRAAAENYYQHSLQIYRDLEDAWWTAKALAGLGLIAHHTGSFEEAVQRYSECLELYQTLGDPRGIANTLVELGHNSLRQGLLSAGQKYIQEGTDILQQIGDQAGVALGYFELGRSHFWGGQFAQATKLMEESEPILEDLGMRDRLVISVIGAGLGFSHLGQYDDAISQVHKGLPIARELDARREIAMAYLFLGKAYLGKREFGKTQDYASKSIAYFQEIDQRKEIAWALALVIFAQHGLYKPRAAEKYLYRTLRIGIENQGYYPLLCAMFGGALILLDRGEVERAVELSSLAWRSPVVANSRWFEDIAGRELAAAAETLPPEVIAAAQERGRERDIWETAAELLDEFNSESIE